jgi:hypothetical protein
MNVIVVGALISSPFFITRATRATSSVWINILNIASLASELVLQCRAFVSPFHLAVQDSLWWWKFFAESKILGW